MKQHSNKKHLQQYGTTTATWYWSNWNISKVLLQHLCEAYENIQIRTITTSSRNKWNILKQWFQQTFETNATWAKHPQIYLCNILTIQLQHTSEASETTERYNCKHFETVLSTNLWNKCNMGKTSPDLLVQHPYDSTATYLWSI